MRIVTTNEMREIERVCIDDFGFSESLIIENVGVRVADKLLSDYLDETFTDIVFIIGRGNNGADGLAVARNIHRYGYNVSVFLTHDRNQLSRECSKQLELANSYGIDAIKISTPDILEEFLITHPFSLVVDAIFGTGIRLPLDENNIKLISLVNNFAKTTASIDIPSGIEGNTGKSRFDAINADVTFAIGVPKLGVFVGDGPRFSGKVEVIDAGFPANAISGGNKYLLQMKDAKYLVHERSKFSHKGDYGRCLVIGGSKGLTGALCMSCESALRSGCGLVTGITWEEDYLEFTSQIIPEVMKDFIPCGKDRFSSLMGQINKFNSVVVGPGLGRGEHARGLVIQLLEKYDGQLVLDADAINALHLGEDMKRIKERVSPTLITPHLGEFARLIGVDINTLKSDPLSYLEKFVEQSNCTVLLKGAVNYLYSPSGLLYVVAYPNDGMSKGGSGDVLSGILGGLLAWHFAHGSQSSKQEEFDRTIGLSVLLHSQAGKIATEELGSCSVIAGDVIRKIPVVFKELAKKEG